MGFPGKAPGPGIGFRSFVLTLSLGMVSFTLLSFPALALEPPVNPPSEKSLPAPETLKKLSVEELINLLPGEPGGPLEFGLVRTWPQPGDDFLGLEVGQDDGLPGAEKAAVTKSPVFAELVRRGVHSMPGLLAHMDDRRPTKAYFWYPEHHEIYSLDPGSVEEPSPFLFGIPATPDRLWVFVRPPFGFSDWINLLYTRRGFDLRYFERAKGRLPRQEKEEPGWRYTMKVGDLCYIAVGRIVNRDLAPITGRNGSMVIDSPVHRPDEARACRERWGRLTAESHRDSLIRDGSSGLKRLYFYYPREGEKEIIKYIKRPFREEVPVSMFIETELLSIDEKDYHQLSRNHDLINRVNGQFKDGMGVARDHQVLSREMVSVLMLLRQFVKWAAYEELVKKKMVFPPIQVFEERLSKFEQAHGKEWLRQIPGRLYFDYAEKNENQGDLRALMKVRMAQFLLKERFPKNDPHQDFFVNQTTRESCQRFVTGLPRYENANIDRAILEVLQRVPHFGPKTSGELAFARCCINRLSGGPIVPEVQAYLEKKIDEAKKDPAPDAFGYDLPIFNELLNNLKK